MTTSTSRLTSPSHAAEPSSIGGGSVTSAEVAQAIATVENSRQTHVQWRDYWLGVNESRNPDCACGQDHAAQADIAGDLDHHLACIAGYDQVLDVLRRSAR